MGFILGFILVVLCLILFLVINNSQSLNNIEFNRKTRNVLLIIVCVVIIGAFILIMFEPFTSDEARKCMFQTMQSGDITRSEAKRICNTFY